MLQRHKRKRVLAATGGDEEEEWDESADLIDDTLASIQLMLNRNADGFAAVGLPSMVVWHQLYTILPNRTFVDQNVHRLRSEGKLVTFKIPSGADDFAVLRAEDYIAEVKKYQRVLREQLLQHLGDETINSKLSALSAFERALPQLTSLSTVSLKALITKLGEAGSSGDEQHNRAMLGRIQRLGFLLPTTRLDDEAYSFSVPGVGKLVTAIKKTRTQILSALKRTKYKETHEHQLKKAKLKHSCFRLEFHLADMEGCSLIRRTKATSGVLVAVAGK